MSHYSNLIYHAIGKSKFIGDTKNIANLKYAKCLLSRSAHAKIKKLDITDAKNSAGVIDIITYKDIPGQNQIGHGPIKDEPLLPEGEVFYIGQPICIVVAESYREAEIAINKIKIEYEELEKILTIDQAIEKKSFYIQPKVIERGDIKKGFDEAIHVINGEFETGGQEHFYLETQRALAIPEDDGGLFVFSATQSTAEVQEIIATILGKKSSDITVDVPRLGGAFGGKERGATLWAALASITAYKTNYPVELILSREEDMLATGKRHPFKFIYRVGFDNNGKITALDINLYSNGGYYIDLSIPILERAMMHIDNCYFIPNIKVTGAACKTNLPPNTAFRGFGAPQGIFAIEYILDKIAINLNLKRELVQKINLYEENQTTHYDEIVKDFIVKGLFIKVVNSKIYKELLKDIKSFNKITKYKKRGISIVPVKFGISFTLTLLNQASALVWFYTDGSVSVSHGGVEMGQGINAKIANIVSREFGLSIDKIRVESSNTKRTGNASPTAASTGTDLNGNAVYNAVRQIKDRLINFIKLHYTEHFEDKITKVVFADNNVYLNEGKYIFAFSELIHTAYLNRVDLGAHGFYKTPDIYFDKTINKGNPFYYYAQGLAISVVDVNTLLGEFDVKKVIIYHDIANSLDYNIDLGQITGAFVQGMGWCTFEEVKYDKNGKYLVTSPSVYKIPTISDVPDDFQIYQVRKKAKKSSIMGSKGIGEPPLIYGMSVFFAIKNAIESLGDYTKDCNLKLPATPENILKAVEQVKNSISEIHLQFKNKVKKYEII